MASKIGDVSSSTKFNWTIENFSKLNAEKGHDSDVFSDGPFKWYAICSYKAATYLGFDSYITLD